MKLSANKVIALFVVILVWSGFALLATCKARAWFWFFFALYPSNNMDMSGWFFAFGAAMAGLYLYLIVYASITNKAIYAWIAIALLLTSGITGYLRMAITRSNSSRGKAHTSAIETKVWAEQARPANRWPVGCFDEHGFDVPLLRHRACWQKSRPSAFAPNPCDPPSPPASDC